jgi:hypothetical protein
VLGFGNGSQAVFSSAEVQTIVDASSCLGEPGSATCPQAPTLKGHDSASCSGITEETNNLLPVIGLPPAHLPPLQSFAVDQSDIEYVSSATGLARAEHTRRCAD